MKVMFLRFTEKTDEIPANADKLYFKIDNAITDVRYPGIQYTPTATHELGELHDLDSYIQKSGQTFSMKILMHRNEVFCTLNIFCYDATNNLVSSKNVPNVLIRRNAITEVEGKLFDQTTTGEAPFNIQLKEDFNKDTIRILF